MHGRDRALASMYVFMRVRVHCGSFIYVHVYPAISTSVIDGIRSILFKMVVWGNAAEYLIRLEDGLDDVIFKMLAKQQPGTLLDTGVVEAGFERITMKSVSMNAHVIAEFSDYNTDGNGISKVALRDAFAHLDDKHNNRLSGATTKATRQIWAGAEAEKLCLMLRVIRKEKQRSPKGSKYNNTQRFKDDSSGGGGGAGADSSGGTHRWIPDYPPDSDDEEPPMKKHKSKVETEPASNVEEPATPPRRWAATTLGHSKPSRRIGSRIEELASKKSAIKDPQPKKKKKPSEAAPKKKVRRGPSRKKKPAKKQSATGVAPAKNSEKRSATGAAPAKKQSATVKPAKKQPAVGDGKAPAEEAVGDGKAPEKKQPVVTNKKIVVKMAHLMTVFLDSSNKQPGLEPDFAVRIVSKFEHDKWLYQIVSPGAKIWGQTTPGQFGSHAPDIADAMSTLVTRGHSKDDLKACKDFLKTAPKLQPLWAQ